MASYSIFTGKYPILHIVENLWKENEVEFF